MVVGKSSSEFGHVNVQGRIDDRFNAESEFWSDIYGKNTLLAHILRQRQIAGLTYVDALPFEKGARVLDVGCGGGIMSVALARRGFNVDAVDHAAAMVEQTRQVAKLAGMEKIVHCSIEDAHEFTFEDNTFELVVALGVIHWLHDLRKVMTEITRVLKPGGYAILSVDTRWGSRLDVAQLLRWVVNGQLRKFGLLSPVTSVSVGPNFYSAKQFKRYLLKTSLVFVQSRTVGFLPITLFNHPLFSEANAFKIHTKLQKYADFRYPIFRSSGAINLILAINMKAMQS